MTLMECIDKRKKLIEAKKVQENKLSEMVSGSTEWFAAMHKLEDLRDKLHKLTMWLYDHRYHLAVKNVLTEAFTAGDFTVPEEIITRIEEERKAILERMKRNLEINNASGS